MIWSRLGHLIFSFGLNSVNYCYPATELIVTWMQPEYTVQESSSRAVGDLTIAFPSGGSSIVLTVQLIFQDISASGGQNIIFNNFK